MRLARTRTALLAAALLAAGAALAEDPMDATREELMAADRAFSELSEREGRREAFDRFMAPEATMYREGRDPIAGREAIMALFPVDAPGVLRWEPVFADVGSGGDLGYTLGTWWFEAAGQDGPPKVSRGHYVTIWKRQPDGAWRYVFDTGVTGPAPVPESPAKP